MGRTAKLAASKLPEKSREAFLRAWKAAHCMDLYGGRLEEYLQIIAQRLEQKTEQMEKLKGVIEEAQKVLGCIEK